MPTIEVAKTIVVLTLPEESQAFIRDGELLKALQHDLFAPLERDAMREVRNFAGGMTPLHQSFLLEGLRHAVDADDGHRASVHFLHLKSGYELGGTGLEIRDDTVAEEKLFGPLRVMFVSWGA